jgi:hypothetical protein
VHYVVRTPLEAADVRALAVRLRAAGALVLLAIVVATLLVRLATASLAFMANVVFPVHQEQGFGVYRHEHLFFDTFARYDSGWYHGIAKDGYAWVEGGRSNLAFLPVYPLAMRWAGQALGGKPSDFYFGGILVAWVACIGAMLMLYLLARLDLDDAAAQRAVLFALLHPCAFFFGVVYSESTFLLLAISAMFGFRTGRWWLGGGAAMLLTATRVSGVLLLPALAWAAWLVVRHDRRQLPWAIAALAVAPAGIIAYSAFCYSLSGNPIEWMASIQRWEYVPGGHPFTALSSLMVDLSSRPYHYLVHEAMASYDTLNGLLALFTLVITPLVWRRFGTAYALVVVASLLLPLSSGQYEGLGRYTSVLFPTALLLGAIRSPLASGLLLGLSSALYMLCLALFTNVHPLF